MVKPMLAGTIKNEASIPFPVLASPKLDGIRAIVVEDKLLSRRLLEIPNRHVFNQLSRKEFHGLDGELVVGKANAPDAYTATLSGIMSEGGIPPVTFWVFDRWDLTSVYTYRRDRLPWRTELDGVVVTRLKHELISCVEELQIYEQQMLAKGFEGVMLRDPQGRYKFGRSTPREFALMKLKRFEDSEAKIIGIVEQVHNANEATINNLGYTKRSSHKANRIPKGTTGALEVVDLKTGVRFEIGTGMDDATRARFWADPPIGKIAKYKFQPTGVKMKPRFPVFLGLRDPKDL
jgi:DNA ligase-1